MSKNWMPAFAGMTLMFVTVVAAKSETGPRFEHKAIEGASPQPVLEGVGLKGREELEAFFDGLMAAHLGAQRVAGATVSVVKDGKLYFAKGYGFADVERQIPVDPAKTLFRPGSTSKLFTWTAVMQLIEQNKLDLDTDVNTYLTQFQIPATFPQPITLRNLMTHTAGFEDGLIGVLMSDKPEVPPLADALKDHIPVRVRPPATTFADGMESSYSNWGTALAGLIVANVSGVSFEDYVEENIFVPLGMSSSTFRQPWPEHLARWMSLGYKYKDGKFKAGEFEYVKLNPAGGMGSTAADMANFMIALLQDGRFGESRILQESTAQQFNSLQFSPSPYISGMGLGSMETWINGRRWFGHGGDLLYFHSNLWLLQEDQLGIFISYNSPPSLPGAGDDLEAFVNHYYPASLPQVKPPPDFKDRAAKYAGTYRMIRHSFTTNEKPLALLVLGDVTVTPTDDNTLLIGGMGSLDSQWVEVAPSTFRRLDAEDMISFPEDAAGGVRGLVWPYAAHALYKIKWYQTLKWHGAILAVGLLMFFVAIVSAVRHWKADRTADPAARGARRIAALLGPCHAVPVVILFATLAGGLEGLVPGWPTPFKVAPVFPLLAIPLTLAVVYYAFVAWKRGLWTRYSRIQYSVIALLAVAFLWSLNFMNLLGFKFA